MVVDAECLPCPRPQTLNVGLKKNLGHMEVLTIKIAPTTYLQEGYDHTEYKPNVYHLDVGCLGQCVENTDVPWVK